MQKINYPLIISDFDGTLVNKDGSISEKNKRAITKYLQAGGKFALSTGRLPSGILPRARELGLCGMVSCCQGAIIMDIQTQKTVLDGRLSLQTTLDACRAMEALDLHIHAYDLWDFYCNREDEALKLYERLVKTKGKIIANKPLSSFLEERELAAFKLLAMVEPNRVDEVTQALQKANLRGCALTKSAEFLVEVVHEKYSKGTAVEFLAKYYGVPVEKTVAVGDQLNDVAMIERAGVGVAVRNAERALKDKADFVTDESNEEGAIAAVIEKFGFYGEEKE